MTSHQFLVLLLLAITLGGWGCASTGPAAPRSQAPPLDPRLDWWRQARFGLFIHWGLYAVPAGAWGDQTNHAEWIRTTARIPLDEYDQFRARFNPVKFDADAWAAAAADAGCRYLVITSKHHDGFCLFDSAQTDFDIMSTPCQRDIMRQIADACRRHGLVPCWYHSIMDWHHPDYLPRRDWETDRPTAGADFDRFNAYLKAQVRELLTAYGPIGVMWFDGEWEPTWTHDRGIDLYRLCRQLQPAVIVNNRVGKGRDGMRGLTKGPDHPGDFGTPEQEIPDTGLPGVDWETCMTMNDHWGYNAADANYKSSTDLIRKLCDIASKGGNFLLNVGPTAEGQFPPEALERLADIGRWMRTNGQAIYGTQASPLADLPWGRCTLKQDSPGGPATLYLHIFDWPADGRLTVDGLAGLPTRARLLAEPGASLRCARDGSALLITLPPSPPDPAASVLALDLQGPPIVFQTPTIEAPADIFIRPLRLRLTTPDRGVEVRYTLDGSDPGPGSAVYSRPIRLTQGAEVRARAFKDGQPISGARVRRFDRAQPRPAIQASPTPGGLTATVYRGEWTRLPDFDALEPQSRSTATRIRPANWVDERIGYRFDGYVRIPRDDVYTFSLASDDGARLTIDGQTLIDLDGLHATEEKRAPAALAAGWHRLRVEWFNRTGDATLAVKMAPAGEDLKPIPPEMMGHD
jgi:alpha-L-fucosidase